jgi:PTS system nitrogen regulatory IIA component
MRLSVKEAAEMLNVSEEKIYRWIKQEAIPGHWINEQYLFNRAELLEWATAQGLKVSPDLFQAGEEHANGLPSLSEALQAGGVAYGVGGVDQATVLRAVVDVLNLPEDVDREFMYQILLARETLGSTGIGSGIAIPHVRNPLVMPVSTPTVTLCFLEHPIDFRAVDGKPVNTLFTLISPSVRAHLHLLSRLGFVLGDPAFKAVLQQQAPQPELEKVLAAAEAGIPAGHAESQD